jgi:aminoglycoside 6'-N-acetyltransferase
VKEIWAIRVRLQPLVAEWLKAPEVSRWWGDPTEQLALLKQDLVEPRMRQWIVEHQGLPFAYVQAYEAHAWPQPHLQQMPEGTQIIDAFVGAPDMLGCGHGQRFIRLLASILIGDGAPMVAVDPSVENIRPKRAYAGAGCDETGTEAATDGQVVVMDFRDPATSPAQ